MNKISSRHHYLPQFYLKGFTEDDGKFSVFDLKQGRLKNRRLFPKQVFFEQHRNTFFLGDDATDFLESEIYQMFDNKNSKHLEKIVQTSHQSKMELNDFQFLHYFITNLFWRIPRTDELVKQIFKSSTHKDLGFQLVDKKTGQVDKEKSDIILESPEFRETYRSSMATVEFHDWDMKTNRKNWVIGYSAKKNTPHICADNPIVTRNDNSTKLFESELIFPISKDKLLFYTNHEIKLREIAPEFRLKVDTVIMGQSQIMAIGTNSDYLKQLFEFTKTIKLKELKEELFQIFE
ncbi:DUF4238 domain-containing protein [Reichenbachiella ulvae]|uniref:DUF4238 domain-containing protein n=1 Tax=Reichenbachiella ulvae TaxID=2980104 RepID=A0ABT3CTH0_9BACT|nr:DUF4238 domain-containing protein [Reichenbachiella ulvae]MCV9386996.1 DUF4238 domain-containing protein [Reichenbachiella ulvae]